MRGTVGVQLVGTITIEASGTASITVAKSNVPFKNLTVSVRPVDSDTQYQYDVFVNGELSESHNYPTANNRVIAHSMWPNMIWPANIASEAIPKYYEDSRGERIGFPVMVRLTSHETETRVFEVYSCYEEFDAPRFAVLTEN